MHDRTRSKFTIYEADRPGKFEIDVILADFHYDHTGDYYWGQLLAELKDWIGKVKFEHEGADPWAEFEASGAMLAAAAQDVIGNRPFTAEEQAAIEGRIEEIKQQTRENLELSPEQVAGIEQKLDDFKEASERVGRKDWLTMLYGAAFGMIVDDTVSTHVVQGIITTVITGLGHIFGLASMPPALPPQA